MQNISKYKAKVRIILALALCLLFVASNLAFFNATAFAAEKPLSERVIKASVFGMEGYHMKDDNGSLTGYGIEFLNMVSEYSHINFQYVGYDTKWNWDGKDENGVIDKESPLYKESILYKLTESKEIDVITSVSRSEEREGQVAFSLPMGRKRTVLSIRVDDTAHVRGDYTTYNGIKIGMLQGNTANTLLDEFAGTDTENPKFTYVPHYYGDDVELAAALKSKEIDAILTSDLRKTVNEKTLDIIAENDFYAVVRKDDTELLKEINYAIEQMDIYEGDWQNVLYYKYYGPDYSDALSLTAREREYLQQVINGTKKITVTAYGDRAPYSYTENGVLKGILPDYFEKLMAPAADEMKVKSIPYTLVASTSQEHYNTLIKGGANGVNVVLDSADSNDIKENQVINGFATNSYMTVRMARVTRLNNTGTAQKIAIATTQGADLIKPLLDDYEYTDNDIVTCTTGEQALQSVLNGEADVAYVYSYTAQYFINHGHTDSLYYSSVNGLDKPISISVSENTDHELVTILNKCIKQISDDMLNQLANEYTAYTNDLSFGEFLAKNPGIIIAFVVGIVLVVFVIIALYWRGQWNKKLLHTTEQSNKKMSEQLAIVQALSRDYTNVYSINEEKATAKVLKLEGYVTEGLNKESIDEFDYSALLQKYIPTRVHPEDQKEMKKALALDTVRYALSDSDEYTGSYRILDNGEIHHFQYTFLKIENDNQIHDSFILAGFRNIDEMIRKEQEQKDVLAEALAEAQYANKAKTTFLNNMSHDIRTPMNAIIGFTSLAVTHLDNKEQIRDYLSKIMTSSNHLLSLINDVLDMSRIESGKVKIEEKETSLPDIMHDLKTIVQADVKAKQFEFFIDTLDVTNETIICDKLRLNQVLLNLLSNAMKYTKPGGTVSVRVVQTEEAKEGYASYQFSVKDTGIGMSPEFLKHVFEPFEREQTATVSGIQGTGLGLAITKNIVDMMGGTISVESEMGKGSEFSVKFRFKVANGPVESPRLAQLEDLRALVVDDDVNTCMSVSKMLSTIGMRPDWTTRGKEAIVHAKFALEQHEPYSAYIIDWLMPDMNGIELVRRIRKVIGNDTPVIIITAYDWTDIEKEAKEAGVTAFCSKPLFLSELRSVLAAPFMEQAAEEKEEESELRFDGKKLLLVEDNELNQEIAQTILEAAGFVIETANDGSVAVDLMKKNPVGTYDLILMDVQMPIMNGYEATKAIRALKVKAKASIPIVAMTANAFEEDKKEALDAGMNGFCAKPIEIEKLMQTLKDILK